MGIFPLYVVTCHQIARGGPKDDWARPLIAAIAMVGQREKMVADIWLAKRSVWVARRDAGFAHYAV